MEKKKLIHARAGEEEVRLIANAAKVVSLPQAAFVRFAAVQEAKQILRDAEVSNVP